jgi:hypothetical protein
LQRSEKRDGTECPLSAIAYRACEVGDVLPHWLQAIQYGLLSDSRYPVGQKLSLCFKSTRRPSADCAISYLVPYKFYCPGWDAGLFALLDKPVGNLH